MRFEVNVNKKHLIFILALFVFVGGVIAYGTNSPSSFGHSSGEIEVTGVSGFEDQSLNSWLNWIGTKVLNHDASINSHTAEINTLKRSSLSAVYKVGGTYKCEDPSTLEGTAFLCAYSVNSLETRYTSVGLEWFVTNSQTNAGYWRSYLNNIYQNCYWVLCSSPDPRYP